MEQLKTLQDCYKKLCQEYAKMQNDNLNYRNKLVKNNDEKDNYNRCLEMLNENFKLLNKISDGIPNLNDKIKGDFNYYFDKPFEYKHLIDKYSNRINNLNDLENNLYSKNQQPNNLNNNISNLGNTIPNNQNYDPCAKYIPTNNFNNNQNNVPFTNSLLKNNINNNPNFDPCAKYLPTNNINNNPNFDPSSKYLPTNNINNNPNFDPCSKYLPTNNINNNPNLDPSINSLLKNNMKNNPNFDPSINSLLKNNMKNNPNFDSSGNYISKNNPNLQNYNNIEQNKKPGILTSKSFGKPLSSGIKLNDIINPGINNNNENEILKNKNKPEIPQYIKDDIKKDLLNPLYKPQGPLQKSDFTNSKYNIPNNNLNNSDKLLISQIPKQNNLINNDLKNKKDLQIKTFPNDKINLSDSEYGINNKVKNLNNNKKDNIRQNNFQKKNSESFRKKDKNLKRIKSYENIPNFTDGNCWACNLGCSVSTTGYSPMNFSPYDSTIKRRDVTPIKEGTIYEQYTRHKRSKSNKSNGN
jgi:hypothetical protein